METVRLVCWDTEDAPGPKFDLEAPFFSRVPSSGERVQFEEEDAPFELAGLTMYVHAVHWPVGLHATSDNVLVGIGRLPTVELTTKNPRST